MNVFTIVLYRFRDLVELYGKLAKSVDDICPVGISLISQKQNVPGF